jgi:flagellar motor switch protein FliN/FliY
MWKIMSNGFLSQEEIDSLLNGGGLSPEPPQEEMLSDIEKDLLGEIGNISMGSASTALSTIINQQVNITTPVVTITTLRNLKESFHVPNIALEVEYISGIFGENLLVMKITDAAIIANLMMGGDGNIVSTELSEIEISAVSEAMNQMIGSAATSMATMFSREVNISPPNSRIWNDSTSKLSDKMDEDESIVQVSFNLTIGNLVDSNIMQLLPIDTAKKIVSIMMGTESAEPVKEIMTEKPAQTYFDEPKYTSGETYREPSVENLVYVHKLKYTRQLFSRLKKQQLLQCQEI